MSIVEYAFCTAHVFTPNCAISRCVNCKFGKDSAIELAEKLKSAQDWEFLDLTDSNVNNLNDEVGLAIGQNKSIKYLVLNDNDFGIDYDWNDNAKFWYFYLPNMVGLVALSAVNCNLGCNIDEDFFSTQIFEHLQFIDLSGNYKFYSANTFLKNLIDNKHVKGFNWSNNYIDSDDLEVMATLIRNNATLQFLTFDGVSEPCYSINYHENKQKCYNEQEYEENFKKIASALAVNVTLKKLILTPASYGYIGQTYEVGIALNEALKRNHTLKRFDFNFRFKKDVDKSKIDIGKYVDFDQWKLNLEWSIQRYEEC